MSLDFCAIDFETANFDRGSPCAVGLVKVRDGHVLATQRWLMRPPPEVDDFEQFNVELHGIRPEDVRNEPRFAARLPDIIDFTEGLPLVAHNAAFDTGVIRDACDWSQVEWPPLEYVCTLVLARRTWTGLLSYSLPWAMEAAGLSLQDHHDPEADARAAADLMLAIAAEHGAGSLAEALESAYCRIGYVTSDFEWRGCTTRYPGGGTKPVLPDINPEADPEHPLYGQEMVFTGALSSMTRQQAWEAVAEAGGVPAKGVTKRTNVLVIGFQDSRVLAPRSKLSRKAQKAADLRGEGQDIEVMPEVDFLQQLGDAGKSARPSQFSIEPAVRVVPRRSGVAVELSVSITDLSHAIETSGSDAEAEREPLGPPSESLTDSTSPPALPRLSRPEPVSLDDREYASTVCPHCGVPLEKLPKARTKCRSCGQPIHVRSGLDQRRHLLRAIDQEAFDEYQWALSEQWDRDEEEALRAAGFLYGDWDVEVVGESYHQPEITDLAALGAEHPALLVREPDNPHDPHAVRVDIRGRTVGHLSRESALDVELLMEHLQRVGRPAWVRARITGGDGRFYGVVVDGMPDDDEWEAWQ